jgi:hypothetical protein
VTAAASDLRLAVPPQTVCAGQERYDLAGARSLHQYEIQVELVRRPGLDLAEVLVDVIPNAGKV